MSDASDADRIARLERELDAAKAEAIYYRTEAEMWKSTADDYAGEIESLTELNKDLSRKAVTKDTLSSGGIVSGGHTVNTAPAVSYTIVNQSGSPYSPTRAEQEVARMIRERGFNADRYNW